MFAKASFIALALATLGGDAGSYPQQCGTLLPGWAKPGLKLSAPVNTVRVQRDGSLIWNGSSVNEGHVAEYMGLVGSMKPQSFTILDIENGAPCEQVNLVRKIVEEGADCRETGTCGEGPGPWPNSWSPYPPR